MQRFAAYISPDTGLQAALPVAKNILKHWPSTTDALFHMTVTPTSLKEMLKVALKPAQIAQGISALKLHGCICEQPHLYSNRYSYILNKVDLNNFVMAHCPW